MLKFERRLKGRGYTRLSINSQVIADEDHLSVFPSLISRGILWALPGFGPRSVYQRVNISTNKRKLTQERFPEVRFLETREVH